MFSRRFGPYEPFETYSSMEVGRHLCHTVLAFLGVEEFKANVEEDEEEKDGIDREQLRKERRGQLFSDEAAELATEKGLKDEVIERPKPLPTYKDNRMWCVLLPNDYHYFHCQTHDCRGESVKQANNISTEDDNGDSYIRVSVNTTQYIQSISYLGSNKYAEAALRKGFGSGAQGHAAGGRAPRDLAAPGVLVARRGWRKRHPCDTRNVSLVPNTRRFVTTEWDLPAAMRAFDVPRPESGECSGWSGVDGVDCWEDPLQHALSRHSRPVPRGHAACPRHATRGGRLRNIPPNGLASFLGLQRLSLASSQASSKAHTGHLCGMLHTAGCVGWFP